MKRLIRAAEEYNDVQFRIYELDEDGEELNCIDDADKKSEAISKARKYAADPDIAGVHVVISPLNSDMDREEEELFYEKYGYDPYEVVWEA